MNNTLYNIGFVLAVALLICLFPMPYGYYSLVRFVAMIVFGCMAFSFYKKENRLPSVIFGSLALLFQPLFKISLGRTMWNIVDVTVAVILVLIWYNNHNSYINK